MNPNFFNKIILFWFFLAFIIPLKSQSQNVEKIRISGNFRNVPLISFFDTLEINYGVKAYYKRAWVDKYNINTSFNNNPLVRSLNSIFTAHELTYEVFQDNSIVVYPRRLDTRQNLEDVNQVLVIGNPINKGKYKTQPVCEQRLSPFQ